MCTRDTKNTPIRIPNSGDSSFSSNLTGYMDEQTLSRYR